MHAVFAEMRVRSEIVAAKSDVMGQSQTPRVTAEPRSGHSAFSLASVAVTTRLPRHNPLPPTTRIDNHPPTIPPTIPPTDQNAHIALRNVQESRSSSPSPGRPCPRDRRPSEHRFAGARSSIRHTER
jgi:hypothetical protein